MISFEMTRDEAKIVEKVIQRYVHHLQVEIMHTDKERFRKALKERETFLKEIIERLQAKILEDA